MRFNSVLSAKAAGVAMAAAASLMISGQVNAGGHSGAPKNLKELIAAAKKEGQFKGMWSSSSLGGGKGFKQMVAAVNKKYGLKIKGKFTPGPSMTRMIAKTTREFKAGQPASTDMVWNNSGGALKGGKVGIMRKIDWNAYLERKPLGWEGFDYIAPGGVGLASAGSLVGIMYNSDLVKGDDIPQSIEDVFKPKFKGKIATTPYAAGMREFGMPDVLGNARMTEYTKRLSKHIGGLMRCGSTDRLTSGEFLMLVYSCGDQYVNRAKNSGSSEPLGYAIMNEAVISHTRYAMVPKNSSAPHTATLVAVWLGSKEGQAWMWKQNGLDMPIYAESQVRKKLLAAKAKGARIVMNSPQWLGSQGGYIKYRKSLEKILKAKKK